MPTPKFDPSKPFKAVEEKPKFDPNQPYLPVFDDGVTPPQRVDGGGGGGDALATIFQAIDRFTGAESTREFLAGTAEEGVIEGAGRAVGVFQKPLGAGVKGKEAAKSILSAIGQDPDETVSAVTPHDIGVGAQFGITTPVQKAPPQTKADVLGTFLDVFAAPPSGTITGAAKLGVKAPVAAAKVGADIGLKGVGKVPVVGRPLEVGIRKGVSSVRDRVAVASDFPRLKEIQAKHGIQGEPTLELEFGVESSLGRAGQRRRLENELGEADKFKKLASQTEDAIDRQIATIGGGNPPLTPTEAGEEIIEAFNDAKSKVFAGVDQTFSDMKDFTRLSISDVRNPKFPNEPTPRDKLLKALRGFEKEAKKEIRLDLSSTLTTEAKDLLKKVKATRESTGSFRQTVDVWRKIGKEAFAKPRPGVQIAPTDQKAIQKLYFDIGDALIETVRRDVPNGEALAGAIQINNDKISKFFKQSAKLEKAIGKKESGEQVFKAVAFGNTNVAREARELLLETSPETVDVIKGALIKSLKKERFLTPDSPSFANFANAIGNNMQKVTNWLDQDELEAMRDLIEFSVRIGSRAQAPGLGRSGIFNRNAVLRAIDAGMEEAAATVKIEEARRALPTSPRAKAKAPARIRRGAIGLGRAAEIESREEDKPFITPPQRIGR